MISVSTAERLWNDFVDNPELQQIAARKTQSSSGFVGVFYVFPEDSVKPSGLMTE